MAAEATKLGPSTAGRNSSMPQHSVFLYRGADASAGWMRLRLRLPQFVASMGKISSPWRFCCLPFVSPGCHLGTNVGKSVVVGQCLGLPDRFRNRWVEARYRPHWYARGQPGSGSMRDRPLGHSCLPTT